MIQSFRGRDFEVAEGTTHPAYSLHTFSGEEHEFRDKYWNVVEGDVVFDVGASYGSYSLTACAMGAMVFAFEPEKTVYNDLRTNIALNGWRDRCFPINAGLWSRPAYIHMGTYAPHWPPQTISGDYEMATLDGEVETRQIKRLDWIKVDVEGAEEHVIRGGLKAIAKFGPRIIVECHVFLDAGLTEKVKALLLSARNYDFEEVVRSPCVMLIARAR